MLAIRRILLIIVIVIGITSCQRSSQVQGYIEGYFTYLASNSDGFLQTLAVQRGEPVKGAQVLFILENQPEASQVAQAQDRLRQAEFDLKNLQKGQRYTILQGIEEQMRQATADLDFAQKTFMRNETLVKTGAVSKSQYDQAKSDFDRSNARFKELMANLNEAKLGARTDVIKSAEAALAAAVAQANIAEWYLAKKSIAAPADGRVFDTYYRTGEFVPSGRPVVSMLIPENVRLLFYVPQPLLSQLKVGQIVNVNCDGCAKTYSATISFIAPNAEYTPPFIFSEKERQKFVFRVEARFSNEDAKILHPGQPVDVSLQ